MTKALPFHAPAVFRTAAEARTAASLKAVTINRMEDQLRMLLSEFSSLPFTPEKVTFLQAELEKVKAEFLSRDLVIPSPVALINYPEETSELRPTHPRMILTGAPFSREVPDGT